LSASEKGRQTLTFSAEHLAVLTRCMVRRQVPADRGDGAETDNSRRGEGGNVMERVAQAFCEIVFKKTEVPKGQPDWKKDMNTDDSWLFPLDIGTSTVDFMHRRTGEHGEVPDWLWLKKTWGDQPSKAGNKYPDPLKVIRQN
jgi:hypothetical protein